MLCCACGIRASIPHPQDEYILYIPKTTLGKPRQVSDSARIHRTPSPYLRTVHSTPAPKCSRRAIQKEAKLDTTQRENETKKYMRSRTSPSLHLPDCAALTSRSLPYRKGTIFQARVYIPQSKASPFHELYIREWRVCSPIYIRGGVMASWPQMQTLTCPRNEHVWQDGPEAETESHHEHPR